MDTRGGQNMNEIFQLFNLPVTPVNWNNGYWLSADLWDTFDYTKVLIGDVPCIIAKPLHKVPHVDALLGQFQKVKLEDNVPIVLQLCRLSERRRKELMKADIPFVSPVQIYLPFMGLELQQKTKQTAQSVLTPLSQQLLFLLFYRGNEFYRVESISEILDADRIMISNSLMQLQSLNLVKTEDDGDNVIINQSMPRRALYVLAKSHLIDPVNAVRFVNADKYMSDMPLAGESALAEYSMLAPPMLKSVAYYGDLDDIPGTSKLVDKDKQMRVEFWAYSPVTLSVKAGIADALSVVSSLTSFAASEDDPRLDKAIDEALNEALGGNGINGDLSGIKQLPRMVQRT
jgi:hypothetical protein